MMIFSFYDGKKQWKYVTIFKKNKKSLIIFIKKYNDSLLI
jgi:hypothetical protein